MLLPVLVAGCRGGERSDDGTAIARVERQVGTEADSDGRIMCAHGTAPLARTCTVERTGGAGGLTLTIRHADGGFRRLLVTNDGRGVAAADGADAARVAVIGPAEIEVAIGADRYRLPATVHLTARSS